MSKVQDVIIKAFGDIGIHFTVPEESDCNSDLVYQYDLDELDLVEFCMYLEEDHSIELSDDEVRKALVEGYSALVKYLESKIA